MRLKDPNKNKDPTGKRESFFLSLFSGLEKKNS